MKRIFIVSLVILNALTINAQRKAPIVQPVLPAITLAEALEQYRYSDAELILNNEITTLRKKKLDTSAAESALRSVARAKSKLNVTEKITFIDSIQINKADLMQNLSLSNESGKIDLYSTFYNTPDTTDCTIYLSELGDNLIYAKPDSKGNPQLFKKSLVGNPSRLEDADWTASVALADEGLGDRGDVAQNYPFMMADGTTLYFAAKGEESLGRYDIFMTRYDAEEHRYLTPENIGMPFNSPANDYLYAVDEFYNIGFFVSDRNQPKDTVCVYIFIPNQSRKIYNASEIGEDKLRSFARLTSISDTWEDMNLVNASLQKVKQLKNETHISGNESNASFLFIINNKVVYNSLNDFKSDQARQSAQWWFEGIKDLRKSELELEKLREKYHMSNDATRNSLKPQILQLENNVRSLYIKLKSQEKEIRRFETQSI